MYFCLLLLIIIPLLLLVVYALAREWTNKCRLKRYTAQGFTKNYSPFLGELSLYMEGEKHLNQYRAFEELANKTRGTPGAVVNHSSGTKSLVCLHEFQLIREYLAIENEVSCRNPDLDIKVDLGFIMKNGEHALTQRAIFSSFFSRENLNKIAPQVWKSIEKHFQENPIDPTSSIAEFGNYKTSTKFVAGLMKRLSSILIYYHALPVPITKAGLAPADEFVEICEIALNAGTHPLNILLGGWLHKLNLLSGSREALSRASKLMDSLKSYIQEREHAIHQQGIENYSEAWSNIIDEMILHNEQAKKSGKPELVLTLDQMAGNCNMFTFASVDSTLTGINSVLFHLGQDMGLQEKLRADIQVRGLADGIHTMEMMDNSELLTETILEAMRVFPPGPLSFDRLILQDFQLGKYKF